MKGNKITRLENNSIHCRDTPDPHQHFKRSWPFNCKAYMSIAKCSWLEFLKYIIPWVNLEMNCSIALIWSLFLHCHNHHFITVKNIEGTTHILIDCVTQHVIPSYWCHANKMCSCTDSTQNTHHMIHHEMLNSYSSV